MASEEAVYGESSAGIVAAILHADCASGSGTFHLSASARRGGCRKDKRILATGYNGAPAGIPHCLEIGCLRQQLGIPSGQRHEICRGLHAEQNVIIQAAVHGISLAGSELYCTTRPCLICTKMLINCGIRSIWHAESYPDEMADAMLREAGVQVGILRLEDEGEMKPDVSASCETAEAVMCIPGEKL